MPAITTPFGRGRYSASQFQAQLATRAALHSAAPGSGESPTGDAHAKTNRPAAVHKWRLLRALTEGREAFDVSDRALTVLSALLSFHPETALSLPAGEGEPAPPQAPGAAADRARPSDAGAPDADVRTVHGKARGDAAGEAPREDVSLIVFPSNRELSLRAQGLCERSLARHLAALVEAGLVIRRDSPNGKRYARRGQGGGIASAFGFDLAPLVLRAPEIEDAAEAAQRRSARTRALRERLSLARRDCAGLLALAAEPPAHDGEETWSEALPGQRRIEGQRIAPSLLDDYARLLAQHPAPRRNAPDEALSASASALEKIKDELTLLLAEAAASGHGLDGDAHKTTMGGERSLAPPARSDGSRTDGDRAGSRQDLALQPVRIHQESGNAGQIVSLHHNSNKDLPNPELTAESRRFDAAKARGGLETKGAGAGDAAGSQDMARPEGMAGVDPEMPLAGSPRPVAPSPSRITPGFIRQACPALGAWSKEPLKDWQSVMRAASVARAALGVSADAWLDAVEAMGEQAAAVTVAAILERVEQAQNIAAPAGPHGSSGEMKSGAPALIRNPGGYLRHLAGLARLGQFRPEPFLMAVMATRAA